MLFTRCPECETTFRVTDETLKKANGQVRCGRCASVFNAYAELRDPNAKSFDRTEPETPHHAAVEHAPPAAGMTAPPATVPTTSPEPLETPGQAVAATDAVAASLGVDSVADVVAQVEQAAAFDDAPERPEATTPAAPADDIGTDSDGPISAKEVDAVLASPIAVPAPAASWPPLDTSERRSRHDRWWGAAAAVAFVTLTAQIVDHYRTDIAAHPTVGPWLQGLYAAFGTEVDPRWDVHQYAILDWVATAEPNARGLGSLKITAHIQNRGPIRQPYPAVQLKLKDRWEEAVGSRLFAPAEYLPSDAPRDRLMAPGETARAEIEVVDPGPDAYGFELDVCIEVEASLVSCGTDEVFL